jgi:hypothetical protein
VLKGFHKAAAITVVAYIEKPRFSIGVGLIIRHGLVRPKLNVFLLVSNFEFDCSVFLVDAVRIHFAQEESLDVGHFGTCRPFSMLSIYRHL